MSWRSWACPMNRKRAYHERVALTDTVLRALQDTVLRAQQAAASAARQMRHPLARAGTATDDTATREDTARDRRRTRKGTSSRTRRATPPRVTPDRPPVENSESAHARSSSTADNQGYMGECHEPVEPSYRPAEDGNADPGEVVWTWVPYDEDRTKGKDRPVLVIARRGRQVLGLTMSSVDHDDDAADEARHGRSWHEVGAGPWDSQGRDSEVRLDRVMIFDPVAIRREGARLDEERFDEVVRAMRQVRR